MEGGTNTTTFTLSLRPFQQGKTDSNQKSGSATCLCSPQPPSLYLGASGASCLAPFNTQLTQLSTPQPNQPSFRFDF